MLISETELNKYSAMFSNKLISFYGIFSPKFLHNIRRENQLVFLNAF